MAFSWGAALTQFGKDLPTVGASVDNIFDERYKRKRQGAIDERQKLLDDLTRQESQISLDKLLEEKTRRGEAYKAMEDFTGSMQPVDKPISTIPVDQVDLSKAMEAATGKGTVKAPQMSFDEALTKSNILKYSDNPAVKNTLDYFNEKEKLNARTSGKLGIGASVYQMKKDDLAKIRAMPEGPEKEAAWEDFLMNAATGTAYGLTPEGIELAAKRAGASGYAGARGRTQAEMDAGGGVNPVVNDLKVNLRDEFTNQKEIGNISSVYQNFNKAKNAMDLYRKGKIAPYEVDQSLAYYASKALDPNSVVMPGEFDRFAKGLGYQTAQAMVEQLINGGLKLTDDQRNSMMNIVQRSWNSAKESAAPVREFYIQQAKKNNLDPYDITGKLDYIFVDKAPNKQPNGKPPDSKKGPAVGTIENGYRFKGGDPSNPNSWEKVK